MDVSTPAAKPLHPLVWVAGLAVIVFSAVGIGAFMGWIPNSMGGSGEQPLATSRADSSSVVPAPVVQPAQAARRADPVVQPAPARHQSSVQTARNEPVHARSQCALCGVIESVHETDSKGSGSGVGAVGGAVLGAIVGNQVGGGHGKDVMTVVGAVGGGLAGNEVEKRVKSTKSYAITVRLDDGSSRVINQSTAPAWHAGDKVRIVDGAIQSNA